MVTKNKRYLLKRIQKKENLTIVSLIEKKERYSLREQHTAKEKHLTIDRMVVKNERYSFEKKQRRKFELFFE
jgi:hypothetical protein